MLKQYPHDVLLRPDHDETARQEFVMDLRKAVGDGMMAGNRVLYDRVVLPTFIREHNRPPVTRTEIRHAMERAPYHQASLSMHRLTYEMAWESIMASLDRQIGDINDRASARTKTRGSLRLDPSLPLPRYLSALDNHCMPGSYHADGRPEDLYQGALYDRGDFIISMGTRGPLIDEYGDLLVEYVKRENADLKPLRILDLGCAVGHDTLPWCDSYPRAEVHAIDTGGPMLRYAHARAESLGKTVHFSQQNAEKTDFADDSVDIVASCLLIHETSRTALRNIFRESRRILKPGGLMIHMDGSQFAGRDLFRNFMYDYSTHYNSEPFIGTLHELDLDAELTAAGFAGDEIEVVDIPRLRDGRGEGTRLSATLGLIKGHKKR